MQIGSSQETNAATGRKHPSSSKFEQKVYLVITLFSALLNSHLAFLDIFTSTDFSFAMLIVHNVILVFNLLGFEAYFAILKDVSVMLF